MDDKTHSTIGRREFLQTAAYGLVALAVEAQEAKKIAIGEDIPALKKNRIAYDALVAQIRKDEKGDKAGNYEALKVKYLDQILVDEFKIVQDKKRNPDGIVKEWFYWPDPKQQKKATERMKTNAVANADEYVKMTIDALHLSGILAEYKDPAGQKSKNGGLLTDKSFFGISTEQDVFSTLDYVIAFAQGCENGIKGFDKNGHLFEATTIEMIARATQLGKVLRNERDVTMGHKTQTVEKYLSAYTNYQVALRQVKNDTTDSGKDAQTDMVARIADIEDKLKSLGYTHKQLPDGKSYELVKTEK